MSEAKRKIIDCRDFPNEIGCTLMIAGSAKEVLRAAIRHAIEEHGHQDTPELGKQIKALMKAETQNNLIKYFYKNRKAKPKKGKQQ